VTTGDHVDDGEAETFAPLERSHGSPDLVVSHRAHACDRVPDQQRPPGPLRRLVDRERGDP
jgi:hypothetical protein